MNKLLHKEHYQQIVVAVNDVLSQYEVQLTVRQIYYRMISDPKKKALLDVWIKDEEKDRWKRYFYLVPKISQGRLEGAIDWHKIADTSRSFEQTEPEEFMYDSPQQYVDSWFSYSDFLDFRKSYWAAQPTRLEVWVEKEALHALFETVCERYRVPVYATKGFDSTTKILEARERFLGYAKQNQPTTILHFSDHDPSGVFFAEDLTNRLRSDTYSLTIKHIGLQLEQVRELGFEREFLQARIRDPRLKRYRERFNNDHIWELDAVPPDVLQRWIENAVLEEIERDAWENTTNEITLGREVIQSVFSTNRELLEQLKDSMIDEL